MTDNNSNSSNNQAPKAPTNPVPKPPYKPSPIRMDTIKNGVSTGRLETRTITPNKK